MSGGLGAASPDQRQGEQSGIQLRPRRYPTRKNRVFRPEFLSKQVAVKLHLTIPLIFMVILHKYRIPMRYFGSFFVRKIFAISAFPECRIKGCH